MANTRPADVHPPAPARLPYLLLAALTMSYGWGYRGTVGHEAGAMVPGALVALAVCLGSGRADWIARAPVAALFGAVGWAWGGSLSYMEQTFYALSDSPLDVAYAYAVLFFLGGLWAGIGAATLGLGLTAPCAQLQPFARVFASVCAAYFAVYLYFAFAPEQREAFETLTVRRFHDGDWFAATLALATAAVHWALRPKDRAAAALFVACAAAWWIGYGLLTYVGGLRLAPLHRSESWAGVLGVFLALLAYLRRSENRAALRLAAYGWFGGGMAFVVAVLVHSLLALQLGPIADLAVDVPAWRAGEITFGLFMGLAVALGAHSLLRGGIAPPDEDTRAAPLNAFAVFVVLIAVHWINFRRHVARTVDDSTLTFLHLTPELWYSALGAMVTLPALCLLWRYLRGHREFLPVSPLAGGVAIALLITAATMSAQLLDGPIPARGIAGALCLWIPAALSVALYLRLIARDRSTTTPSEAIVAASDARWSLGRGHAAAWATTLLLLIGTTAANLAVQDGPMDGRSRLRFGDAAYWRQTARLEGTWRVVGPSIETDIGALEFDANRNVAAITRDGERVELHRWFLMNQYLWIDWYAKSPGHPNALRAPLIFESGELKVNTPKSGGVEQLSLKKEGDTN